MTQIKCRMTDCKYNLSGTCIKEEIIIMKFRRCLEFRRIKKGGG